jgi:excinuclease ABC subunit B
MITLSACASTTKSLIERRDVIVVASVSSIYGLGDPDAYRALQIALSPGVKLNQRELIRRLALLQYDRTSALSSVQRSASKVM